MAALSTTLLALLTGWFIGARLGGPALPWKVLGILGLPVVAHCIWMLRRTFRAWAASFVLGAFWGLGMANLAFWPHSKMLGWAAAVAGFAGLMLLDRLYRKRGAMRLHSAQTLLTGHYLMGILAEVSLLLYGIGALKLFLYLRRHRQTEGPCPLDMVLVRVFLGFVLPLVILPWSPLAAALCAATGEWADRREFYRER